MKKFVALVLGIVLIQPVFASGFDPNRNPGDEAVRDSKYTGDPSRSVESEGETTVSASSSERRVSSRGRTVSTSLRSSQQKVITSQNSFETQRIESPISGFSAEIPIAFLAVSDTLTGVSGELIYKNDGTRFTVSSSGEKCEGRGAAIVTCLKDFEKDFVSQSLSAFSLVEKKQAQTLELRERQDVKDVTKQNTALWSVYDVNTGSLGLMVFLSPQSQQIFTLKISAAHGDDLLTQRQFLLVLSQSLFGEEKTEKAVLTNSQQAYRDVTETVSRRTLADTTKRTNSDVISSSGYRSVLDANNIISLSVPAHFEVTNDTLTRDDGVLELNGPTQSITIEPTEIVCDSQTRSTLIKCLEDATDDFATAFSETQNLTLISNTGSDIQLVRSGSYRTDIARTYLWQSGNARDGGQRFSLSAFINPNTNKVWTVKVSAPEDRNEILWNVQVMSRVLSSIKLEKEE